MPRFSANVEPEMIIWILRAHRSEYKQAQMVQDGFFSELEMVDGGKGGKNIYAEMRDDNE